jgi:soluble lytic murein transglycosylase-like protein
MIVAVSLAKGDVVEDLVPIIIQAESSGNPQASDGQSYGLMGISPSVIKDYNTFNFYIDDRGTRIFTHETINIGDLYDPSINVKVGTWHLRRLRVQLPEQFKDSKVHLIAAYNWGLGNLRKNNWVVPKWFYNHPNKIYRKIAKGEK